MRAAALIDLLKLTPHPEGGHYREIFRSEAGIKPDDDRPRRSALTSIDFVLQAAEFSAWHRVGSDEAWHLLEGGPLRLWCLPPALDRIDVIHMAPVGVTSTPRHIVPAGWWQAAEPVGEFAYVGATVGPGFEFDDFSFARDDSRVVAAIARLQPDLLRLAGVARP